MRGVEPMVGDVSARHSALNAGKRVVELDITSAADRDQLRDLVSRADVFLHNWAPGKAEQLGLDAEALARVRPGLTYAWASGWGSALGADPPVGTDYLVQAHSGLAAALSTGASPEPSLMTITDVLGGLVCAQGVLASLLHRVRTGRGSRVQTSLLSAAWIVPRRSAPRSVLRTADGFVALPGGSRGRAAAVLGRSPASGPEELDELASREPTSSAVARFADAGVTATPVHDDLRALITDPRMRGAFGRDSGSITVFPWEFS
jgi:crotonobetainyl-CoA:carnitine CoA-transferase CaiB-like acyl-CoA transferase